MRGHMSPQSRLCDTVSVCGADDDPLLPPRIELETKAVLKQCIPARAALAGLKQATELIPNPTVLINTIPLLEAKDSSEIENIVTTTDQLFRHADGHDGKADPACSPTGNASSTKNRSWTR